MLESLFSPVVDALERSSHLPSHYCSEAHKLRDFYYSIEIDAERSVHEKVPYMVEW